MPGIGLILNPRAGRSLRDPQAIGRLARQLDGEGLVRTVRTRDELMAAAEELRRHRIDLVGIAGGDGTNHVTISGLIDVYGAESKLPALAFLRGGTMNTVANSLGIPRRRPETLLALVMRTYAQRHFRRLRFVHTHILRVGSQHGFIFGTGAIYGFISAYKQNPVPSFVWAGEVLARAIASHATGRGDMIRKVAQRWQGSVTFDDGSAFPDLDYLSIGASTCVQIGLGFRPFYRNGELPYRFHILGIHASAGSFIRGLPRIWAGRTLGGERTYEKLARCARLESRDGAVRYALDGDVYVQQGPLEIACGPPLRILIPDPG